MESDSSAHGILLIALFLCFSQPQLSAQAEAAGDTEDPITVAAHTRKAKTSAKQELPRRIEIVPVSAGE